EPAFFFKCHEADPGYRIELMADPNEGFTPKILNGLYDVWLQLEESDQFGDMNTNVLEWKIQNSAAVMVRAQLVFPPVEVAFPCWDYPIGRIRSFGDLTAVALSNYAGAA